VGWSDLSAVIGPLLYAATGVLFSETVKAFVVAFNQRVTDRDAFRKRQHDDVTAIQLKRIDDAAEWRRQQELRITALDVELAAKDQRISDLVDRLAQKGSEMTACERERDWWKERYQATALELNEIKYPKRRDGP
jgi:pantothenate kinase-related protein Tda10